MAEIEHKRGLTLRLRGQWREDGVAIPLGGDTLTCRMVNENYEYEFSVEEDTDDLYFEIFASKEDTALWPLGSYSADLKRVTPGGDAIGTKTFYFKIIPLIS